MARRAIISIVLGHAALMSTAICVQGQALTRGVAEREDPAPRIAVFITGNAKSVFGNDEDAANAAGTLGLRRWGEHLALSAQINVAATIDTLRESLGASILTPAGGRAFNSGIINFTWEPIPKGTGRNGGEKQDSSHSQPHAGDGETVAAAAVPGTVSTRDTGDGWRSLGLTGYLSASTHRWAAGDESASDQTGARDAWDVPILGLAIGLGYPFVRGSIEIDGQEKAVEISSYLAWSHRWVFGDLAADALKSTREDLLGTDQRGFHGVEVGLRLQYSTINAELVFYHFGGEVEGLSNGQIAAGISITADLITGVLDRG